MSRGHRYPPVANFAYSHKQSNMTYFDEQRAITLEATRRYGSFWNINRHCIVSKFCKVPFEITLIRDSSSQLMAKFHELRAITPEKNITIGYILG